jgi:hypothetical protein
MGKWSKDLPLSTHSVDGSLEADRAQRTEAHQGMHHRQLARVIELEAWYPLAVGQDVSDVRRPHRGG